MRLAGQLLAVSAVTLLLPWAGCQYAREVESALRDGEQEAVVASARLLAAALAPAAAEFAAEPERWRAGRGRALDLYVHELSSAPVLDGFAEDWGEAASAVEHSADFGFLAGRRGAFVHVFAVAPGDRPPGALRVRGRALALDFPFDSPGPASAVVRGAPADPRARAYWQATSRGWQVEARVPAALLGNRLGLALLERDGTPRAGTSAAVPGWMTGPDPSAQSALEALGLPGQRVFLVDRAGFVLARVGATSPGRLDDEPDWRELLFRGLLGARLEADPPPGARPGQLSGRHIELAALGASEARRFATPQGGLLAAAAPVGDPAAPAALVVVERDTAAILSLTRDPTRRLVAASFGASLLAALILLGFAALLSFRIRRLRDAATIAVSRRGEVTDGTAGRLPGTRAGDELGDLARRFDELLRRVREHNLYLQSLGGRLAHELRTPLAVVRSSLDNLEAERPPEGPWLARARGGVDRMNALVSALSAAQRIERAVATAEHERFDVGAQLADMVEAYRTLHPARQFDLERPPGPCMLDGSPELLAQLLDKLVDNAVDFAAPGTPIRISLAEAGHGWRLAVANAGSRLPSGPPERLFDSLVSVRPADRDAHLGLGLFIVRLVAEHHDGRVHAADLPGGAGVELVVELPRGADVAPRG